jgi:hypothetical protein
MQRILAITACVASLDVNDKQLLEAGPIALQYGSGLLKWRKVQIRSL